MCTGSKGTGWDPAFAKLMGASAKRQKLDHPQSIALPRNGTLVILVQTCLSAVGHHASNLLPLIDNMPMFTPSTIYCECDVQPTVPAVEK